MRRRNVILLLMALLAGSSGCAGTARRDDGSSIFGPRAWNTPTAPPQRPVTLVAAGSDVAADPALRREGFARYFPGLVKKSAEAPAATVAEAKYRPTWFGLRSTKPATTTTYMTDTRAQLDRMVAPPTALPVALQVPTDRASSDRLVTPTGVEAVADAASQPAGPGTDRATSPPGEDNSATASAIPDFGGKPSRPGEDEVNPLPPAAEPGSPAAVVNRMPRVPPVDPLADVSTSRPESTKPAQADEPPSDELAVKASTPPADPAPPSEPPKPKPPTSQVVETSKVMAPTSTVYASPQGIPPRPTSQAKPSPQVKPSPQGAPGAKTWKRPCLRRLVRKVCKLGEYADPPSAAPH